MGLEYRDVAEGKDRENIPRGVGPFMFAGGMCEYNGSASEVLLRAGAYRDKYGLEERLCDEA